MAWNSDGEMNVEGRERVAGERSDGVERQRRARI